MRKEGYCAYGAARTNELAQALQKQMSAFDGDPLLAVENALDTAHRLQTCLTLFRVCYPKTRVALWKRRLRRLLRALNAQRDTLRLIHWIQNLSPPKDRQHGVRQAQRRLSQQADAGQEKIQSAWQQWLDSRTPNEMQGLSRRWVESFGGEAVDPDFAQRQWTLFLREQQSALNEAAGQSLEVRCGRVRALLEGCELMQPLLGCQPDPEWQTQYDALERRRWQEHSKQTLESLLAQEAVLRRWVMGHLRGFTHLRSGWEWLIEQLGDNLSSPTP